MSQNDGNDPQLLTSAWPLWANYVSSPTTVWPSTIAGGIHLQQQPQPSHCIYYCYRCNAVYQFKEHIVEHKACNETRLFQPNSGNWFECHSCSVVFSLADLYNHMAYEYHDVRSNWDEQFMSYFCMICKTMFYTRWSVIIRHRMQCRSTLYAELSPINKRIPSITVIMRRLIKDYLDNGRESLKYACIICKRYESNIHPTGRFYCTMCTRLSDKINFYCGSCNVMFFCSKSAYDTHLNTFEHVYIMIYRTIDGAAVPDSRHCMGRPVMRRRSAAIESGRGNRNDIFCD